MKFHLKTGRIEKATRYSAAFDLFYVGKEPIILGPTLPKAIPTGVTAVFDPDMVCIIKERSGLSLREENVRVKAGVIDSDFRDEWKVIMVSDRAFTIDPGMKIAQFIMVELPYVVMTNDYGCSAIIYKNQERDGGFGSTGN